MGSAGSSTSPSGSLGCASGSSRRGAEAARAAPAPLQSEAGGLSSVAAMADGAEGARSDVRYNPAGACWVLRGEGADWD